jgi:dipeptidyl aminopeptidase/acylaminoacyl peptidase
MVDDSYMRRRVKIVDVATGSIEAAIANPGKLGELAWSPDSSHLAMISAIDINDPSEGRLMVVSGQGGDLTEILPSFQGHVTDIAWQDAETVMYLADVGCETIFGEVRIDGSGKKLHVPAGGPVFSSFSLSRDGRAAAFLGQSPTHPSEVYTMGHGDIAPTRLTFSNAWLPNMEFARQEVVEYRARDGLRLQGILVHPLEEKEGTRHPLILTVHGGPESHYRNGWMTAYSMAGQVGAAEGFAVFYPNYRGSTGRGVPFSKLSQGDPAGKEFDDYVDGVDHLVAAGLVDRDRVGITGGSYGGYATAWGSTYHTQRFAAGVMFVGISDKISKWGTSDIPYELFAVHDRHYPWQDWDLFRRRSPVTYAPQSRTALLILHGKDDPRVHPSQSLELYRYLDVIGKTPVRLVWYPGEGHGNRKAAARLDYNLRLLQWMTHYLKGPGGEKPDPELSYDDPRQKAPGARPVD